MLYYKMYTIFTEEATNTYNIVNNIRLELDKKSHLLSVKEAHILYNELILICSNKVDAGNLQYTNMLFSLSKSMIEQGCLSYNKSNTISYGKYYNIIITACEVKELEWAKSFAKEFHHHVSSFKDDIYKLCMATIYYEEGAFEKTMDLLRNVEFSPSNSMIYCVKLITLATYIELKEWSLASYYIESFRILCIRRKELSKLKKERYLNYLKIVKKLLPIYQMKPSEERNEKTNTLRKHTQSTPNIVNKSWLVEQFDKLLVSN